MESVRNLDLQTNRLTNCLWSPNFMQKKIRKNYNIVTRASYIFDVGPMLLAFKNGPMERSYKFRWILTLTEVMSFRILSMRMISANMNF